jgi:hypothetical protein
VYRWYQFFDAEAEHIAADATTDQLREATRLPWPASLLNEHPADVLDEPALRRLVQDNARVVFAALSLRFIQVREQGSIPLSPAALLRPAVTAGLLVRSIGDQDRVLQLRPRRTLNSVFK